MQSRWLAAIYDLLWRPVTFALSTGFCAPSASREQEVVLSRLPELRGAWLDLSCGTGLLLARLVDRSDGRRVVGLDLSPAMLERARAAAPGAVLVHGDAGKLPFDAGTFAAVTNLAALDLYQDPRRVVAEAARVLVGKGRYIASTFVSRRPRDRGRLSGTRAPTIDELAGWMREAGLVRFDVTAFGRYVIASADKP
jgi:SAM-dependent methyltransferase